MVMGKAISELAPVPHATVPTRIKNKHTVIQALDNGAWIKDIQLALSVQCLVEFLNLCEILAEVLLNRQQKDQPVWKSTSSGVWTVHIQIGVLSFLPWLNRTPILAADLECNKFVWLAILGSEAVDCRV